MMTNLAGVCQSINLFFFEFTSRSFDQFNNVIDLTLVNIFFFFLKIASGFYKRQKRTRDWLPLETLKFYRSLQTIGTDFSVMLQLFPNRSRRDLKLKVINKIKKNSENKLINIIF